MAMLITKFNKLIANKFVWIGFTFLIVISFAFMGMAGSGENRDRRERQAVGTLFGNDISAEAFQRAYANTYLGVLLAVGQPISITEEIDAELRRMAWKRLAALMKADQMGLRTSDREVVAAIRSYPVFQDNGQFSTETYRMFVNQYLASMGFSAGQFEEQVAEELVLEKLRRMLADAVWVPPLEVDRAIQMMGDEFTIRYVRIDDDTIGEIEPLAPEAVEAYFEAAAEQFMRPPKVKVDIVRFPIAAFKGDIEVTEEQARIHYDLHLEEYQREETLDAVDTEEDEPFTVTATIPFEEVQEQIKQELRQRAGARRAADRAMDFVVQLVPDQHGDAPSFDEAAAAFGVEVERLPPFARHEIPENVDAGPAFSRAAFDRRPNPEHYFSDAIEGEAYIYVLALVEQLPEKLPPLAEVEAEVRAAAERAERARRRAELAAEFSRQATELLAAGRTWDDVVEQYRLESSPTLQFSAAQGLEEPRYGQQLVRAALQHNSGEVAEPLAVGAAYAVVFIEDRTAVDPALFADFRPHLAASLAREQAAILFEEWQRQLLVDAEFTSRDPREQRSLEDEPI